MFLIYISRNQANILLTFFGMTNVGISHFSKQYKKLKMHLVKDGRVETNKPRLSPRRPVFMSCVKPKLLLSFTVVAATMVVFF